MCEKVSVVKAQKSRWMKKSKEVIVDALFEEKRISQKRSNEIKYMLDTLEKREAALIREQSSKLNYMKGLAVALIVILILLIMFTL